MSGRQQWEYLIEHDISRERLAQAGAEGWELVSVMSSGFPSGNAFYFKRPAADLRERVTLDHRQRFAAGTARPLGSAEAR